ncbi:hypothetical protein [Beggiatoa leptomitoformis]|uniref:Uncharacterized protein n=1 Tax=Beggiatoa leptomitoformis TaxID=288004 RepID=A0A2N9YBP0_9GAMM|nr:hypothetical protein [Beggiatoa leptomitoformis]ALG66779.1 hypothetical protein AL038_02440 [Beggiatoa leptomitoformis]AUI67876.1 hypothetical protein BLE401_03605 [Beggiatoa leptomitoformis]
MLGTIRDASSLDIPNIVPGECSLLPKFSIPLGSSTYTPDFSEQSYCDFFTALASFFIFMVVLSAIFITLTKG